MLIQTLEELTLNAWPGLQTVFYDGWILRFANGYTRRANSILPLYPARMLPEEKIAWSENLYRQRGMPVIFKLPGRSESQELHALLIARGYQAEADTSVQLADIRSWTGEMGDEIQITPSPTPAWEEAYCSMSGLRADQQANHRQILAAILPQKCFATLEVHGECIGCALGVLQKDFLGIYDVVIHPAYRRQGYGERLMRSLVAWGRQHDAQFAYLQVMLNNPTAQRLYARLGFQEQYQYWYCVKAGNDDPT